jgi:hypothetical protein
MCLANGQENRYMVMYIRYSITRQKLNGNKEKEEKSKHNIYWTEVKESSSSDTKLSL